MGERGGRMSFAGSQEELSEGQNGKGVNGDTAPSSTFSRLLPAPALQPPPPAPSPSAAGQPRGQPLWKHFKSKLSITW